MTHSDHSNISEALAAVWTSTTAMLTLTAAIAGEDVRAEMVEWMRGSIDTMPASAGRREELEQSYHLMFGRFIENAAVLVGAGR